MKCSARVLRAASDSDVSTRMISVMNFKLALIITPAGGPGGGPCPGPSDSGPGDPRRSRHCQPDSLSLGEPGQ